MIKCHLSRLLGEKRIRPAEIHRDTGINKGTLSRMYNEKIVRVDLDVLDKICEYLQCSVGEILEYQANDPDNHSG
nr:helix-turn-helix transcriptional regulator [Desulfobulbaceae bacterium]